MPFCSATWAIASGLAGIEGADQELRAVADQFFGARARRLDTRFGVAVHDRAVRADPSDLRIAGAMSTPRWQSWPMPASKPERGNSTPTFSGPLCARPIAGAARTAVVAAPTPTANCRRVTRGIAIGIYGSWHPPIARFSGHDAGIFGVFTSAKKPRIERLIRPATISAVLLTWTTIAVNNHYRRPAGQNHPLRRRVNER